jgi:hypothetical protein
MPTRTGLPLRLRTWHEFARMEPNGDGTDAARWRHVNRLLLSSRFVPLSLSRVISRFTSKGEHIPLTMEGELVQIYPQV